MRSRGSCWLIISLYGNVHATCRKLSWTDGFRASLGLFREFLAVFDNFWAHPMQWNQLQLAQSLAVAQLILHSLQLAAMQLARNKRKVIKHRNRCRKRCIKTSLHATICEPQPNAFLLCFHAFVLLFVSLTTTDDLCCRKSSHCSKPLDPYLRWSWDVCFAYKPRAISQVASLANALCQLINR